MKLMETQKLALHGSVANFTAIYCMLTWPKISGEHSFAPSPAVEVVSQVFF